MEINSFEDALAAAALVFFLTFGAGLVVIIQTGRRVMQKFADQHRAIWEAADKPMPGYLDPLRQQVYSKFLWNRGYADIGDASLVSSLDRQRTREAIFFGALIACLAGFGVAILILEFG